MDKKDKGEIMYMCVLVFMGEQMLGPTNVSSNLL